MTAATPAKREQISHNASNANGHEAETLRGDLHRGYAAYLREFALPNQRWLNPLHFYGPAWTRTALQIRLSCPSWGHRWGHATRTRDHA